MFSISSQRFLSSFVCLFDQYICTKSRTRRFSLFPLSSSSVLPVLGLMSFYFLPTDVWIPSSPDSFLNPIASVWLKSALASSLSVAPVVPLLRSWAVYVRSTTVSQPSTPPTTHFSYRGAHEVLLKGSMSTTSFFRGLVPLMAAIPLGSAFWLTTSLSGMMATTLSDPTERIQSAATAVAAIGAGELLVQPLRFLYFHQASSLDNTMTLRSLIHQHGFSVLYRGFLPALAASSVLQLSPHLSHYFGLQTNPNTKLSVDIATYAVAYTFFAASFRMACDSNATPSSIIKNGPRFVLAGAVSMTIARFIVSTLQSSFSAKSYMIPF